MKKKSRLRMIISIVLSFLIVFSVIGLVPMKDVKAEGDITLPCYGWWKIDASSITGYNYEGGTFYLKWRLKPIEGSNHGIEVAFVETQTVQPTDQYWTYPAYIQMIRQYSEQEGVDYSITEVYIDPNVGNNLKFIPDEAFLSSNTEIFKHVNIHAVSNLPSSIEAIGKAAFQGNAELTSIKINQDQYDASNPHYNIKFIGAYSFAECGLTSANLYDYPLTEIGFAAYRNNTSMTTYSFPESLKKIGQSAFEGCSALEGSPKLPTNLEEIGDAAFLGTKLSGGLILPGTLKKLGNAYSGVEGITGSVTIPSTLEYISQSSFDGTGVTGLDIRGNSLKSIPWRAFSGMPELKSVTMTGIQEIYQEAFASCPKLSSVNLGSVKLIGERAFAWDTSLTSINLPEGLLFIGDPEYASQSANGAFRGSGLTSVTIPSSVKFIGDQAFMECADLETVTITPGNEEVMIGLPCSQVYDADTGWSLDMSKYNGVSWVKQSTVNSAMAYVDGYHRAFSEDNIMYVDTAGATESFAYCPKLTTVNIPDNVKYIAGKTFSNSPNVNKKVTVSFNSNGGSEVAAQTVIIGNSAYKPSDPTKKDNAFRGWFTDSALTTEYDFSSPVMASITLYAKWVADIPDNKPADNSNNQSNQNKGSDNKGSENKEKKYSNEWVDGKWYDKNGNQTYGGTMSWKKNATGWWVEDTKGWYPQDQWQKIDGKYYYFDESGYMAADEWRDGYWLGSDGAWDDKYKMTWKRDSKGWWIEDKTGWYPQNQWQKIDGNWYYFKGDGYMATSQYINGWWVDSNGVCQ